VYIHSALPALSQQLVRSLQLVKFDHISKKERKDQLQWY